MSKRDPASLTDAELEREIETEYQTKEIDKTLAEYGVEESA